MLCHDRSFLPRGLRLLIRQRPEALPTTSALYSRDGGSPWGRKPSSVTGVPVRVMQVMMGDITQYYEGYLILVDCSSHCMQGRYYH
jgi:hypothetical protein